MSFVHISLSVVAYNGVVSMSYINRPLGAENLEDLLELVGTGKNLPFIQRMFPCSS